VDVGKASRILQDEEVKAALVDKKNDANKNSKKFFVFAEGFGSLEEIQSAKKLG
jgi:hypothetical protein